jgi:hypothetical protein
MSERYRVVFNGEYVAGSDPLEVVSRLEVAFNITRLRALALIGRPPAIIHHGLDLMAATQEMQALAGLGLLTEIVPEVAEEPWDGTERRLGERRANYDRREGRRNLVGDLRRQRRGRRSTDPNRTV